MPSSFGDRMRTCRRRLGWSQRALARQARVDVGWISRLESGERSGVSLNVAERIADALGVTVDYLLKGTDVASDEVPVGTGVAAH